ncbi:hypothetical protein RRG08_044762 [Elysia crispata]|uniref:Uncharacterized protein n=1 Tax=Elysia crispata TaxID=231223 RepID=A0AAE0ZHR4_9GAST|nr:hypothetical protein RRG08_044762 [Elysia crispata]
MTKEERVGREGKEMRGRNIEPSTSSSRFSHFFLKSQHEHACSDRKYLTRHRNGKSSLSRSETGRVDRDELHERREADVKEFLRQTESDGYLPMPGWVVLDREVSLDSPLKAHG